MLFVVKKTVMFVDNFPERLEVALRGIGEFFLIDAGDEGNQAK
jgi:hypothetical protein